MGANDDSILVVKSRKGYIKRQALIQAAFEFLSENDLRGLTIAYLCEVVGLKRNSFYTHFAGLDELLDALSDQVIGEYVTYVDENRPVDPDLLSVTRERIELVLELGKSKPNTARVLYQLYIQHRRSYEEIQEIITNDVVFWMERGYVEIPSGAAPTLARMTVSIFMDILQQIGNGNGAQIDAEFLFELMSRLANPQMPIKNSDR